MIIEKLSTPVTRESDWGTVTLTHRAWGSTHQPWNKEQPIQSYSVLGVMKDGAFKPFPGTEQYVTIKGEDYDAIVTGNATGKKDGVFRTDDVIAKHKDLLAKAMKAQNLDQPL